MAPVKVRGRCISPAWGAMQEQEIMGDGSFQGGTFRGGMDVTDDVEWIA